MEQRANQQQGESRRPQHSRLQQHDLPARAVDRILAPRPVRSTLALTEAKTDGALNSVVPGYPLRCNVNVYSTSYVDRSPCLLTVATIPGLYIYPGTRYTSVPG